jgi:hypothetical protein
MHPFIHNMFHGIDFKIAPLSFSNVKACVGHVGRAALLGSTWRAISRRANSYPGTLQAHPRRVIL